MIDKLLVKEIVEDKLRQTDCFLVEINISSDNNITIEIDSETSVDLNFCVELTHYLKQKLNRDLEDYSLEIGSYSITKHFIDKRQYIKNIGRQVEVLMPDNKKIKGVLVSADDNEFIVETKTKELLERQKHKKLVKREISFLYDNIKQVKLVF